MQCPQPLYRAVVLCSAGVVLATGSPLHLLLLVSLAAVLRGKARLRALERYTISSNIDALEQLYADLIQTSTVAA